MKFTNMIRERVFEKVNDGRYTVTNGGEIIYLYIEYRRQTRRIKLVQNMEYPFCFEYCLHVESAQHCGYWDLIKNDEFEAHMVFYKSLIV